MDLATARTRARRSRQVGLRAVGITLAIAAAPLRSLSAQQSADTAVDIKSASAIARLLALPAPLATLLLQRNLDIAAQRAMVATAVARHRAAGPPPISTITVEAEEVPGGLDLGHANTRVIVERAFFTGGRGRAARALSSTDVATARAALSATVQRTLAVAARSYVGAIGWTAIARRLAAEDSLLASAEISLRARFATGQARYVDVLRLRTERLRLASSTSAARAEALVARRQLGGLVGGIGPTEASDSVSGQRFLAATALDSLLSAPAAVFALDTMPQPPSLDSLVAASATVRESEATIAAAQAIRAAVLAEQQPKLSAYLGGQRFLREGQTFTLGPVFGATMNLPFGTPVANQAARLAADQAIVAARVARTAAVGDLRAELEAALVRYEAARERLTGYSAALLRGAQEERQAALANYRAGELTLLELIDFERALAQAETGRLQAAIDATDALATLVAPDLRADIGTSVRRSSTGVSNPFDTNAP